APLTGQPVGPNRLMLDIERGVHQDDVVVGGGLPFFALFGQREQGSAGGGQPQSESGPRGGAKEIAAIGHGASEETVIGYRWSVIGANLIEPSFSRSPNAAHR